MTTSAISPFDASIIFPDNGLLSQAYDSRVSQNDMLKIGMKIMHQQAAYTKEKNLLGANVYIWEPDFIAMIDESFLTGVRANFSQRQGKLFSDYMAYVQGGLTTSTTEAVIALDTYLGSRP